MVKSIKPSHHEHARKVAVRLFRNRQRGISICQRCKLAPGTMTSSDIFLCVSCIQALDSRNAP